ncbi:MAG: hypothetical protein M3461_24135 [Pseudomonadota bacterium]|nr:hypothetical protein [Pseudomonadota bacterium]
MKATFSGENRIEPSRHSTQCGAERRILQIRAEGRFSFESLDAVGTGAIADGQQLPIADNQGDKLIASLASPKSSMDVDLRGLSADRLVEDLLHTFVPGS